jgi:hypothetical protein
MDVEIYDEREIDSATLTGEPDAEAMALITELGLTVQVSDSGKRQCYPQPTADQGFVMQELFPRSTKVEAYDAGVLPLRVLKEIRSYRAEHPDHVLVVRHCAPAQLKDPILVAYTHSDKHDYYVLTETPDWKRFRLVARWGDGLEAWDKMLARAIAHATDTYDEALLGIIAKCESVRAGIARGVKIRTSQRPHLMNVD